MGIFVLGYCCFLFKKRIARETQKNKLMLISALGGYFAFSLFLNWFMRNIYKWEYGIPGSDLQMYFEGAKALKRGVGITNLASVNESFSISLTHLGYIAFIILISSVVMTPVIFNMEFSLQILYCIQAIVGITSVLNIADFFDDSKEKKIRNKLLWMLLLCAPVFQMSALLMRDIWILFFISCLLLETKKEKCSRLKCYIYMFICFVTRYYTLAITIPIYLAFKCKKKKLAVVLSTLVFATFFLGQGYISSVAQMVGIKWEFGFHFDLYSLFSYIMFPSPISQAYNVQHMSLGYHAMFGGNTEWIYYLLSCWNVFVFPVVGYGVCKSIKKGNAIDVFFWGIIVINIAMLMCLFYNATSSPRHKLLIIVSLAYFFREGIQETKKITRVIYAIIILLMLLVVFFIV